MISSVFAEDLEAVGFSGMVSSRHEFQSSYFCLEAEQFNLSNFFKLLVYFLLCYHLCLGDYNSDIEELL